MGLQKKLLLYIVLSVICLQGYAQDTSTDVDYTQLGSPMPELSFMEWIDTSSHMVVHTRKKRKNDVQTSDLISGYYKLSSVKDLNRNGNVAVMIFSPECTHCNKTVSLLEERLSEVTQTKVILLTTAKMQEMLPFFAGSHPQARPPRVHIGYDSTQFVPKTFLYQPLPQVNLYDAKGILIKSFVSDVVKDSLNAWAY